MNVTEKIFALHDVDGAGAVRTGDIIRISVDWIMASEASWHVSSPFPFVSRIPSTHTVGCLTME